MMQISIFELLNNDEMYDGYEVSHPASILLPIGSKYKLQKGKYYLITRTVSDNQYTYTVAYPNQYGGSFCFSVSENQFKKHFKPLGDKLYPKSLEIWNGKKWMPNSSYNAI